MTTCPRDSTVDLKQPHPCGKCTWRSFTNNGIAGCFKQQKLVDEPCEEYTEK